jgi:hypothetical protein
VTPRLLTDKAVADYLSLPLTVARKVMAGRVVLGGRVRWDRLALDTWLDEMRGARAQSAANSNMTGPDAALAQFLAGSQDAARRS